MWKNRPVPRLCRKGCKFFPMECKSWENLDFEAAIRCVNSDTWGQYSVDWGSPIEHLHFVLYFNIVGHTCTTNWQTSSRTLRKHFYLSMYAVTIPWRGLSDSRGFISDWTTTGPQDQHKCCWTGPMSTCAGFIYLFALNIKINWFGGPVKRKSTGPAQKSLVADQQIRG